MVGRHRNGSKLIGIVFKSLRLLREGLFTRLRRIARIVPIPYLFGLSSWARELPWLLNDSSLACSFIDNSRSMGFSTPHFLLHLIQLLGLIRPKANSDIGIGQLAVRSVLEEFELRDRYEPWKLQKRQHSMISLHPIQNLKSAKASLDTGFKI